MALSSCEAEIVVASEAAKEAVYLSRFLQELDVADEQPTELCVDNQAAIDFSYSDEHQRRTSILSEDTFTFASVSSDTCCVCLLCDLPIICLISSRNRLLRLCSFRCVIWS